MHAFFYLLIFVFSLWCVELVDFYGELNLEQFGILPRDLVGLRGIPLSVFLHGDFPHLISNTWPLVVMGGLVSLRGHRRLLECSVFVVLVGGILVWLTAGIVTGYGVHVGASGLVFGYFGYLVARGIYEGSFSAIFISVFVVLVYGTIIFGILPTDEHISWEGHLFGLLAGMVYAGIVGRRDREPPTITIGNQKFYRN